MTAPIDDKALLRVGLIVDGVVLGTPVRASASLAGDKLSALWGSASIKKSLTQFFVDITSKLSNVGPDPFGAILGGPAPKIELDSLSFAYTNNDEGKYAQIAASLALDDIRCHFFVIKGVSKQGYVVGVSLETAAPLKINVLKDLIGDITIGELGVRYASEACLTVPSYPVGQLRTARPSNFDVLKPLTRDFPQGLEVFADIKIAGVGLLDPARQGAPKPDAIAAPPGPGGATTAVAPAQADAFKWVDVQKTIGPLSLRRVGMRYRDSRIELKLDAGLGFGGLTLNLEGMGLRYSLDKLSCDPKEIWNNLRFNLDGAAVAFARGPIVISGGLIKTSVNDAPLKLDGTLLVKTGAFCLSAIGSYANLGGSASFFVFASLHKALGGPPEFFVTGVAFGFGVNRDLKLPSIDQVHAFPLVKAAMDADYLGPGMDLRSISDKLAEYIAPLPGHHWMAAGVKFSSYGLIESFALLSVSFGTRLEIALLGLSRLEIPKTDPKADPKAQEIPVIARVELALRVVFAPDAGLISCEGRLTESSFILHKDFKLRGGFALCSWFSGPRAGDFVVSLGGYHRKFSPPVHYPRPDLVEFDCRIGDAVSIRGSCYFALCPSALMAGGKLSILYEAGGVKAWFIAYADFLIQWKPLYYDARIGVIVGFSARLGGGLLRTNIAAEVSATVALYGPPLGGEAKLSLSVISFTVKFGTEKKAPLSLVWDDPEKKERSFVKSFLPDGFLRASVADGQLHTSDPAADRTAAVADGRLPTSKPAAADRASAGPVLVIPHGLAIRCDTAVPVTKANWRIGSLPAGDAALQGGTAIVIHQATVGKDKRATQIGVRPVNAATLDSTLELAIRAMDAAANPPPDRIAWSPILRSVPSALWSAKQLNAATPPTEHMIDGVCLGIEVRMLARAPTSSSAVFKLEALAYARTGRPHSWSGPGPTEALPAAANHSISATVCAEAVVKRRAGIVTSLRALHPDLVDPSEIRLDELKKAAPYLFQATPQMARVGQYPPRSFLQT